MDSRKHERVLTTEIYTDGSLKKIGNITFGGWAFIVVRDQECIYSKSGSAYETTNQRMELTAITEAISYIEKARRPSEKIIIYSDSAYIINCYLQEWYIKWLSNGWINAQGTSIANIDLWRNLIPYFDNFWYDFKKVPAHSGHYWNEKCDTLAQQSSQIIKDNWRG